MKRIFQSIRILGLSALFFAASFLTVGSDAVAQIVRAGPPNLALHLNIQSSCVAGKPLIRVRNVGAPWPGVGELQLIDATSGRTITARTLRLKHNQMASFDLKRMHGIPAQLALRVDPRWFERTPGVDTVLECR